MSTSKKRMAIWGSCVSRDTLEYMPDVEPRPYVARQSAIVTLAPYSGPLHLDALDSVFQRRMMKGDAAADVAERITESSPDAVLIDLVDERRGVWRFPDGSYLTNSVEAFRTGIDRWASAAGAQLIEFGTDEHFELWLSGFKRVARRLRELEAPIILLDIAWAELYDGQQPQGLVRSFLGTSTRHLRRRYRNITHLLKQGSTIGSAVKRSTPIELTEGEAMKQMVRKANTEYRRYIAEAGRMVDSTVRRDPNQVRMDPKHRWGPGPYHYREADYRMIGAEIRTFC